MQWCRFCSKISLSRKIEWLNSIAMRTIQALLNLMMLLAGFLNLLMKICRLLDIVWKNYWGTRDLNIIGNNINLYYIYIFIFKGLLYWVSALCNGKKTPMYPVGVGNEEIKNDNICCKYKRLMVCIKLVWFYCIYLIRKDMHFVLCKFVILFVIVLWYFK